MALSFITTIRVVATVLPGAGVFFTSLRLYYRWSRRHLGWDDAWAAFAAVCAVFLCAGAWTRSDTPATGPFHHGPRVRILGYYMLNVAFTCTLWASRLSILCSIIRLIPYMMKMRIYAYICAVFFGLMWTALVITKIVVCEVNDSWKQTPGLQCVLGPGIAGFELATDFIADLIIVLMPIRLLWRIKLSTGRRAILTGIFSASMFTTVISVIHGTFVFSPDRNAEGVWAHVLAATALVVCNLAVLVTWFMRVIGYREESEVHPSGPTPRGTGRSAPKDLSTLRFHRSGPIVLNSLDVKGAGKTTLSTGSWDSVPPTVNLKAAEVDDEIEASTSHAK